MTVTLTIGVDSQRRDPDCFFQCLEIPEAVEECIESWFVHSPVKLEQSAYVSTLSNGL